MAYLIEIQLKNYQDESMLDEMAISLFPVLWEILENGFPEQQHYRQLLHVAGDRKLENALKRGWEKAEEVAEKERSDRARVKVKRKITRRTIGAHGYNLLLNELDLVV